VLVLSAVPPVLAAYHWIALPVAVRLATVPLLQKLCEALPVGAAGTLIVTVTAKRVADSQPLIVCEAWYVVPFMRAVLVLSAVPPVLVAYHWIEVPVAVRLATVPLLQKLWEALPVGAVGTLMVAVTARRVADSHPLTVCEA
jgi:hypothetical protein